MTPILDNLQSTIYFLPEELLTLGAMAVFLVDLAIKDRVRRRAILTGLSFFFLAGACLLTAYVSRRAYLAQGDWLLPSQHPVGLFNGLIVLDPWAVVFKYLAWVVTALAIWIAAPSKEIPSDHLGEYLALLLAISVGLSLMACSTDMLMILIGVELVSMVSYALAGFRQHDRRASEAALKYMVYGGVASGMMLFGMSYLYGLLGSTNLVFVGPALRKFGEQLFELRLESGQQGAGELGLVLAVVLVLSGVGYKIASVPWHMWCPDVYEGAPTPFTAFLSVGPKAAGFGLAVRIFYGGLSQSGGGDLATAISDLPWPEVIGVISAITMTLGNFAALNQTNLKRMLAYSSIAHAGYLLMGLAAASATGSSAVVVYLIVYTLMNLGAFLVVDTVARHDGSESLFEYRGLSSRSPFVAVCFAIFLFSLTGLPPLAGFVGKFHLFKALIDRGGNWQVLLAIIGVMNSAISLYYYARIVRTMFLERAGSEAPVEVPRSSGVLIAALAVAVIVFGVYFDGLRRIADRSLSMFGHS